MQERKREREKDANAIRTNNNQTTTLTVDTFNWQLTGSLTRDNGSAGDLNKAGEQSMRAES